MKNSLLKISAFAALAGTSQIVLAQVAPYTYNVSWGTNQALPFSPWLSVAIGLMILLATYAFIRKHAGQGLFMLAAATLVGGLAFYTDKPADAFNAYSITTPNGSDTYTCGSSPYGGYVNQTSKSITLTVTPTNGGPTSTNSNICHTGIHLSPSSACLMPCVD